MNVKNFVTTHKQGISHTSFSLSFLFLAGIFGGCENNDISLLKCLVCSLAALAVMAGSVWYGKLWKLPLDMEETEEEAEDWKRDSMDSAFTLKSWKVLKMKVSGILSRKKEDDHEKRNI